MPVGPPTSRGPCGPARCGRYPGEVTFELTPWVREQLAASGHTGRQFAPYLARVIGPHAVAPPAGLEALAAPREADEGWMAPLVEVRRLARRGLVGSSGQRLE